jgi:hypothetical protein
LSPAVSLGILLGVFLLGVFLLGVSTAPILAANVRGLTALPRVLLPAQRVLLPSNGSLVAVGVSCVLVLERVFEFRHVTAAIAVGVDLGKKLRRNLPGKTK